MNRATGRPAKPMLVEQEEILRLRSTGVRTKQLARLAGISPGALRHRLRAWGAPSNPTGAPSNHVAETEELIEILDGLLLGDGSVSCQAYRRSARLSISQRFDRREWLECIRDDLDAVGVRSRLSERPPKGTTKAQCRLDTLDYVEFRNTRDRWYVPSRSGKDIKVVPSDVRLTPRSLALWFCGDGCLNNRITFATNGFDYDSLCFLRDRMSADGWGPHINKASTTGQFSLRLNGREQVKRFQNVVRPFMPACFAYKMRALGG
jgi:hypothetical protein